VSLIVPFAAGGPADTLARNLAQQMTKTMKQQVIVEIVPEPAAPPAPADVAKTRPDGCQVLIAHERDPCNPSPAANHAPGDFFV